METTVDVTEQTQVAEVRRLVAEVARNTGMSAVDQGRAALVATEAATNLVKYGKAGNVTVGAFDEDGAIGVQLLAVDKGPGFGNFVAATRDGFSTGGSLGIGLGAIMRSSDFFDVYTAAGEGTALMARVAKGAVAPKRERHQLVLGQRTQPKLGQIECGDRWARSRAGRWQRVMVADGLGHGPLAAVASRRAADIFKRCPESMLPSQIVQEMHDGMRDTRGAVVSVVSIDPVAGSAIFCGIGNIAGAIYTGHDVQHHLMPTEGTVGYSLRKPRDHYFPWTENSVLVLSSDGLSSRWNLARYPGLPERHPALGAAVLYRDFARNNDDATVVVARCMP